MNIATDPAQLRLLALIDAHGSLSGAAAELALTPAAVTAQVARAEAVWGVPLVNRGPRGAILTEAGRVLARHGEAVDDACVAARGDLDAALGVTSTRLRIGTFSSAAIRLLPEAMTAVRHRHPDGDLSVEEITSVRGEELVSSGRIDVAVVATYDDEPSWPDWLHATQLLVDPLLVCLPAEHRLAQGDPARRVRLAQLRGEPWVAIMRGESARAQFDRAAEAVDLRPRVMFETEAYDVAQALVGTGLGAAVLTRLAVRAVPGAVHRELERPRLHRRLWAMHLRDTRMTPLVDEFVALLGEVAADLEVTLAHGPRVGEHDHVSRTLAYAGAMTRTMLATAALLAALLTWPGPAVASPASEYAASAVKATNAAREANGRKPLKVDECLRGYAVKQARAMAASVSMSHQDLGKVMNACGLVAAGENVAYGYPTGRSVVNQGWMKSPGHRANILNRGFRLVAVGARRDDDGTWYAAQVFGRR